MHEEKHGWNINMHEAKPHMSDNCQSTTYTNPATFHSAKNNDILTLPRHVMIEETYLFIFKQIIEIHENRNPLEAAILCYSTITNPVLYDHDFQSFNNFIKVIISSDKKSKMFLRKPEIICAWKTSNY